MGLEIIDSLYGSDDEGLSTEVNAGCNTRHDGDDYVGSEVSSMSGSGRAVQTCQGTVRYTVSGTFWSAWHGVAKRGQWTARVANKRSMFAAEHLHLGSRDGGLVESDTPAREVEKGRRRDLLDRPPTLFDRPSSIWVRPYRLL